MYSNRGGFRGRRAWRGNRGHGRGNQPYKRPLLPGPPLRSSTPDPSGSSDEKIERHMSNRNKIRTLQTDLSDTAKSLSSVALELAEERKLRLAAERRANESEQKLAYFEGRARHFEYHARSNAKKLRRRNIHTAHDMNYPTNCCYTENRKHNYYWHRRYY